MGAAYSALLQPASAAETQMTVTALRSIPRMTAMCPPHESWRRTEPASRLVARRGTESRRNAV
jgi:hypothetical protein